METDIIKKINHLLIKHTPSCNDVSLLNGKMGVTIYFFEASKEYHNSSYLAFAEALIDEIIDKMEDSHLSCGFNDGLAGIVWGFEYLIRNKYISTGEEDSFSGIDDRIFRNIVSSENLPIGLSDIAGYMNYLFARITGQNTNPTSVRYHQRLLIELVNKLSQSLFKSSGISKEPLMFDVLWDLPLVLLSLSKLYSLNLYQQKIQHIIEQLSPGILSLFPRLHANRLYLAYAMEEVTHYIDLPEWNERLELLKRNISMEHILSVEAKDRAIAVKNGISGISLIVHQLFKARHNNTFRISFSDLEQKISNSEYWIPETEDNIGILYGQAGMGLALLKTSQNQFL